MSYLWGRVHHTSRGPLCSHLLLGVVRMTIVLIFTFLFLILLVLVMFIPLLLLLLARS